MFKNLNLNEFNFGLGFDWNDPTVLGTYTIPGTSETIEKRPLLIGLPEQGIQTRYEGFQAVTDYICFVAVNLSTDETQNEFDIIGGSVKFAPPHTPCNFDELIISNVGASPKQDVVDLFVKKNYAATSYPVWPLLPFIQLGKPSKSPYRFSVTLVVKRTADTGESTRAFFHDPEMIVGGTN